MTAEPWNGFISQVANLPVCPAGGVVAEEAASVLSLCHCECAADFSGHC